MLDVIVAVTGVTFALLALEVFLKRPHEVRIVASRPRAPRQTRVGERPDS